MWPAIGAASGTFLLWFLTVTALFTGAGTAIGWAVRGLIPPGQTRLPRHLWMAGMVGSALAVGALAGFHIGETEAVLSFGDSLAQARGVQLSPFPTSGADGGSDLSRAVGAEAAIIVQGGLLRYLIGHVALGSFYDPMVVAASLIKAARATPPAGFDQGGLGALWTRARPDLHQLALQKMASWTLFAFFLFAAIVLSGLSLIVIGWAEMHRHLHLPPWSPVPTAGSRVRPPGPPDPPVSESEAEAEADVDSGVGEAGLRVPAGSGPAEGATSRAPTRLRL